MVKVDSMQNVLMRVDKPWILSKYSEIIFFTVDEFAVFPNLIKSHQHMFVLKLFCQSIVWVAIYTNDYLVMLAESQCLKQLRCDVKILALG